jgi:uncharacterized membrane protein YqjE
VTDPHPTAQQAQPGHDRSIGELFSEITSDLSTLMRQEVQLAKAELRQEAKTAGKAVGMGAGAGLAGWMVAVFASLTLLFALSSIDGIGLAWSALIVTVLWAVALAVLGMRAKKLAAKVGPPKETIDSLKEDAQWARNQK